MSPPSSCRDAVLASGSPRDALLVIADYVDELRNQAKTSDPWDEWADPAADLSSEQNANDEIAELEAELHGNEDPEQSKVLRARIELAKDALVPDDERSMHDNTGERTEQIVAENGDVVVEVPKADELTKLDRLALSKQLNLEEEFTPEVAHGFLLAGPLYLYYSVRDYIMQQPVDVKQKMIIDVEKSSPAEAHEFARDIMKVSEPGSPDWKVEQDGG